MPQLTETQINNDAFVQVVFMQMATSNWLCQSLYAAAKLGIADLLIDGEKNYEELAQATGTHARSLYRLLRFLASLGVFAETQTGNFTLTPLANYLRSDIPDSLRAMAIMNGEEQYRAWGEIIYSLQTGKNAFEHLYGTNVFDYYNQNLEPARIFDQAMTSYSVVQNLGVVQDYDFSGIKTLVDVGGGNGKLLTDILAANPKMKGILFDQPSVIARAFSLIESAGVQDRCQLLTGSFFESVPSGGDAYILKMIIHDWDDERAIAILKNCHKAMPENGKLLIIEQVVPPGNQPSFAKLLDLHMLIMCQGGHERTETEYRHLIEKAGFQLKRIVPTQSGVSVIEGVKV
ncbi:methyltransferase [Anabaena azotica]|uniref:Methyltransferase n=1 Tax=Anabaena azotica FACHB-119 TaxID=947527 RepID=A0ABR8DEK8_9NOST|nr:methyltransferase [Anabaena azotica]MBD2504546.1 methyltransferase [Anabaena azotica FACHB-119]